MSISVATISNPEFINLQPCDINPLMSSCEIKVLYVGQNRNHTFITKEVATEMSKTLRGAPIVGWFKKDKDDFVDHGDRVVIDGEGVKFECLTKPYGFVSPDARVWFQKFTETNDFGQEITREYLMTTGYLWTGQFEECKNVIDDGGRPHSMELDKNTINGKWTMMDNSNIEFFIINDAIFSKLCILGEDVEPCFEGSIITAPNVSKNFTLDNNFRKTLYNMMQDLKFTLKGETQMDNKENQIIDPMIPGTEKFSATKDNFDSNGIVENEKTTEVVETSFVKSKEEKEEEKEKTSMSDEKENSTKSEEDKKSTSDNNNDNDDKKKKEKYTKDYEELEQKYLDLEGKYTILQQNYQSLIDFKNKIEKEKKDKMIKDFYMLSDEDKKDVVDNKDKYSLDEIEAKLSIIYTKKQMASEQQSIKTDKEEKSNIVTYSFNDNEMVSLPDWVKAVKETEKQMNMQ